MVLIVALSSNLISQSNVNISSSLIVESFYVFVIPIVSVFILWMATKYSADFIKNRYIISDSKKIILFSTVCFLIINGAEEIYYFSNGYFFTTTNLMPIIGIVVFYLVSRKCVKNDTQII